MNINSIKARLKNYSKKNNKIHQNTITKFFQERFLYRLSISEYKSNFLLKGGALAYSYSKESSRHTKDIDFLLKNLKAEEENILKIIQEICNLDGKDGVTFATKKIKIEDIQTDGNYSGIRIKIKANLDRISDYVQIDIGIGDYVTPGPQEIDYPIILEDLLIPQLEAYSLESLVSEKFNAMIDLGEVNSRLKDFYDVYSFIEQCDKEILTEAITNTFKKRKTSTPSNPSCFELEFYRDKDRSKQWTTFLKKNQLENIDFENIHTRMDEVLKPIYVDLFLN